MSVPAGYKVYDGLTGMVRHRRGILGGLVLQVEAWNNFLGRAEWRDASESDYDCLELQWRACGLGKGYRPISGQYEVKVSVERPIPAQPDDDKRW